MKRVYVRCEFPACKRHHEAPACTSNEDAERAARRVAAKTEERKLRKACSDRARMGYVHSNQPAQPHLGTERLFRMRKGGVYSVNLSGGIRRLPPHLVPQTAAGQTPRA